MNRRNFLGCIASLPIAGNMLGRLLAGNGIMSERDAILALQSNTVAQTLWAHLGDPSRMGPNGECGINYPTWKQAGDQRQGADHARLAVAINNEPAATRAWKASNLTWTHQKEPEGYIENNLGYPPDIGSVADAFFLQGHCRSRDMIEPAMPGTFSQWQPRVSVNANWIAQNFAVLTQEAQYAPNRLLFYANALAMADYQAHKIIADDWVDMALDMLDPAGWFAELGGWDSSYQAVSAINLMVGRPYLDRDYDADLVNAITWLASRILPTGEVETEGNTRTGPESPEGKAVNYPEVATALFYSGVMFNRPGDIAKAELVVSYFEAHA